MPPDDSFGFEDNESVGPARPDMAKENPEEPVAPAESRTRSSLLQDSELLAQGGVLNRKLDARSQKRTDGVCHGNKYPEHRGRVADGCGLAAPLGRWYSPLNLLKSLAIEYWRATGSTSP